jgi:hypothetical protein
MNLFDRLMQRIFQSALLWGGLLSVGFYVLLNVGKGSLDPWLLRALTGRWEAYLCVALFFIGVASLTIRAVDIVSQWLMLLTPLREESAEGESAVVSADVLLAELNKKESGQETYLYRRLRNALQLATRNVASKSLASHLRELADADRVEMDQHYDLTRFLTWALPAVGSLATVLGIAAAISQLNATTSAELITGVTLGLAAAFDTFALALGLSIVLMLYKFIDSQSEQRLLAAVDRRVNDELSAQLAETVDSSSAQMEQLRMLTSSMVKATEKLTQQQNAPQFRQAAQGSAPQGAEIDEQKMETLVARAMATAMQQQTASVVMPSGGGEMDMAGWKPLQQALQQVASYLARQQAKQENEGEVVQQLINIIDDELREDQPVRNRPELRMHSAEDAAVSLWK